MQKQTIWGYIRVSSREQNEDRQKIAMDEFGVKPDCVVMDKQSGKDFDRPGYRDLIDHLGEGDVLVVQSIDRLGRNYEEIIEQWRTITKEKKAAIVVLDMPLLDTRGTKDLAGTFIADMMLQLLSYVAQLEREFNNKRVREGIAAAKCRGVRFGRPEKTVPEGFDKQVESWRSGRQSFERMLTTLNMSKSTFYRVLKNREHE